MPRPPRHFEAGIYHVAAYGSDTRYLFVCDLDRTEFVDRLGYTFWQREIELLAYTLMGNHYHALVWIPDKRLSHALQRLHTEHSRQHNRTHQRGAHLFRAHCLTRRINDDEHLLAAYRYLARNPLQAGLVDNPLDWPWSSARAHAGLEPPTIPLNERPLRAALGNSPNWRQRYAELIRAPDASGSASARLSDRGAARDHHREGEIERGGKFPLLEEIAGAGFEPATSGL